MASVVVVNHRRTLAKTIGPDAGLAYGIVRVECGGATFECTRSPGHQFQSLLVFVDEMQKPDLAIGEFFRQFQPCGQKTFFRQLASQRINLQ